MCWGEIGAGGADLKSHQHVYTGLWPIQSIEEDQEDVWGALRFKKQAEGGGNGAGHIKGINRHCHKSGGGGTRRVWHHIIQEQWTTQKGGESRQCLCVSSVNLRECIKWSYYALM